MHNGSPFELREDQTDDENFDITTRFNMLEKIGEGTYGMVYKAVCYNTGKRVAIKKIQIQYDDEGVPATALREISLLTEMNHINVVRLYEVYSSQTNLFLVFECLDMDLRAHMRRFGPFKQMPLRNGVHQLFRGLEFCHGHRILHRDLKPQNVLIDVKSMRFVLADFGLARYFSMPLKAYTHEVVTLWYRAPEILLGQQRYAPPVDIWSLGCILAEMVTGQALFPGDSEIDTIFRMFRMLGTPTEKTWPGVSTLRDFKQRFPHWADTDFAEVRAAAQQVARKAGISSPGSAGALGDDGIDLLQECLKYNMVERPSAKVALNRPFFDGVDTMHTCEI
jgi:serine/threonine protein kinase